MFGIYSLAESFGVIRPEWLYEALSGQDIARWLAYYKVKRLYEKQALLKTTQEADELRKLKER